MAHSQSELAVTYPYAALDGPSLAPRYVGSMTVANPLPETVVDEFRELVAALQDLLDEAIDPVRERLMLDLMDVDRAAMVAKGGKPNILGKVAAEFDPRSRRSPYPKSQTVYWD